MGKHYSRAMILGGFPELCSPRIQTLSKHSERRLRRGRGVAGGPIE
jgi:hypothetical protein